MIAWAENVNNNAYGMETTLKENVIITEFESGKSRTYLKNSSPKMVHSFMLDLKDTGATSEYKRFLSWWKNDLKSGSLSFAFQDLITGTGLSEYKMTEVPSATGQKWKTITITVEEM